jgi:hypothetical protein
VIAVTFLRKALRNPVLGREQWSVKDACAIERCGSFHLFFSVFDQERSGIGGARTRECGASPICSWCQTGLDAAGQ